MRKKWIVRDANPFDLKKISGEPEISELTARILYQRGIRDAQAMKNFLEPEAAPFHDPFLMRGMREAVDRIKQAIDAHEKICVYGDYDVDGMSASAILIRTLRKFDAWVENYIPDRSEGYGLNIPALEKISANGTDLLISVDCGSTSKAEVAFAKSLGLDVIITDHHSFEDGKTPDTLIVNPKYPGNTYPFRDLSGCGVAFKIAQAIERICAQKSDGRFKKANLNALLDLVAISTVADVVPLTGENRTLVKYGLGVINRRQRRGLAALLDVLDIQTEVTGDSIAYILAPNINALGRMGSARLGVELLTGSGKSMAELYDLAIAMNENNKKRKKEQGITAQMCSDAMKQGDCGEDFLVIEIPGGHEGVAGIVAGNIKEKYYKPVFVLTPNTDGNLKGTGRCIPDINLHEMMSRHSDLFIRFGGHSGACGFTMLKENLPALRQAMEDEMKELGISPNAYPLPEYFSGDINDDGVLDNRDGTILLRKLAGWDVEANPFAIDVDRDGTVDNKDGTILLRKLAGWDIDIH